MKTRIKNLLLLLLLLAFPGVVQAQDAYSTNADGSIYTYSTNADGSANIVAYAGPPWVVTIPTNIHGLTVTTIGVGAFGFCTSLANITIPSSVTTIGDEAFYDCTSLMSVTIPNSVTSIGDEAFDDCTGLTNVMIGNSVTSIGENAFGLTSLTSVTIPGSVTSIGYGAFSGCSSLTNATIDNGVISIGEFAFEGDDSLTRVYFTGNASTPTNDSTVFSGGYGYTDPADVYYLPGTTGWGAMFDGLPTAPWFLPNPQILNHCAGFGVQPGGFGFTISWATNASVVVQAATNLAKPVWIPVSTNTLTAGTNYFSDPQWTNYPGRFYRVTSAPTSTPTRPVLTGNRDLDMYNAAVADGTANGGVPGVMLTEHGGPFRVTALVPYSDDVADTYTGWAVYTQIVGTESCSSTTFPSGTWVIQFGTPLGCGDGSYYGY